MVDGLSFLGKLSEWRVLEIYTLLNSRVGIKRPRPEEWIGRTHAGGPVIVLVGETKCRGLWSRFSVPTRIGVKGAGALRESRLKRWEEQRNQLLPLSSTTASLLRRSATTSSHLPPLIAAAIAYPPLLTPQIPSQPPRMNTVRHTMPSYPHTLTPRQMHEVGSLE